MDVADNKVSCHIFASRLFNQHLEKCQILENNSSPMPLDAGKKEKLVLKSVFNIAKLHWKSV
jgi:hypothetical protein